MATSSSTPNQPLHKALLSNDLVTLKKLIKQQEEKTEDTMSLLNTSESDELISPLQAAVIHSTTALQGAVSCNSVPSVKLLFKHKVNYDKIDRHREQTPMHVAVIQRCPTMVKLLAEYGASLEVECKRGYTPLFYAISNDDAETLQLLLQLKAKSDHVSSVKSIYPLNLSASLCKKEMTEILINHGASVGVSAPITGDTPLHSAAASRKNKISKENQKKSESIIELLIENGSEVDSLNKKGFTPLQLAIKEGNYNLACSLVRLGAAVNRKLDSTTDFHYISKFANKDVIQTFLEYGADPSALDENGMTPFLMSLLNPNTSVPNAFCKFGYSFNPYLCTFYNVQSLRNVLVFLTGIVELDVGMMNFHLEKGVEVRSCSEQIPFPFHYAVVKRFNSGVQLMLERGVAVGWVDYNGDTPLHVAAKDGHYLICLYLLGFGSSYNVLSKSTGKTPIDLAAQHNRWKVVDLFKEIEELFKCRDKKMIFNTLKCKIENYCNEPYELLAILNCVNRKGDSLMALALRKGYNRLAHLIMKFRIHF